MYLTLDSWAIIYVLEESMLLHVFAVTEMIAQFRVCDQVSGRQLLVDLPVCPGECELVYDFGKIPRMCMGITFLASGLLQLH